MMVAPKEGVTPMKAEELREAVLRLVEGLRQSDPPELAGALFRDDGDFTAALLETFPRLVSAAAHAARAFAESLEKMPATEAAELVAKSFARVNGSDLGEAMNALSRLVIRLHEENPELFTAYKSEVVAEAMEAADFGKLRKAITYRGGDKLDLARREVALLGDNPVALVNLFSVVAPLVNEAVGVLKSLTEILALPAEAMTYALFKILEDIDWREIAAVINGVAAIVVTLHRGSYIIGDGSLYTKGPFSRISSELMAGLDGQALAEALQGIGEEGEALLTALADHALDDAGIAVPMAEALVSLTNSFLRTAAGILEKAASLPPETAGGVARALANLEAAELARALNALAAAVRLLAAQEPGLLRKLSREVVAGLGVEPGPEAAAAGVNRALASYNAWADGNPGLVARGLDDFLAGLDKQQLERAAANASSQVAEALSRNPAVTRSLVKAVMSLAYGTVKGLVKGLRGSGMKRGV